MKNRKKIAVIAVICIMVLVVFSLIGLVGRKDNADGDLNESVSASSKDSEEKQESSLHAEKSTDAKESVKEESMTDESEEKAVFEDDSVDVKNTQENIEANDDLYPVMPETQGNNVPDQGADEITFPYAISNSDLVIQNITSYDGIYLEDGSDSSVSEIYSIVLKNSGNKDVEYAKITLKCNDTELSFEVSDIPAGSFVVAQESSKTAYHAGKYTDCNVDIADGNNLEQCSDKIKVQENTDGSLTVFNLTDSAIPCVRLFYKFYMEEENAYIGGITYTVKLLDLEAKGSQTITPSHYSSGYSKVVMIRTYESQE